VAPILVIYYFFPQSMPKNDGGDIVPLFTKFEMRGGIRLESALWKSSAIAMWVFGAFRGSVAGRWALPLASCLLAFPGRSSCWLRGLLAVSGACVTCVELRRFRCDGSSEAMANILWRAREGGAFAGSSRGLGALAERLPYAWSDNAPLR